MLGADLVVSSYVIIREGCPVAFCVDSSDQVQVTCGRLPSDAFEFLMEREALRTFVEMGVEALAQMDSAVAREP